MFTEKYKPRKLAEIAGQGEAVSKISKWFGSWKPGSKALLLHGPSGTGKSSVIEALASERNLDFIEMNASDYRSAKLVKEAIGSAVGQQSIFRRGKVFMIDEVDGLSGASDRGGAGEVAKLVESSKHPIVLTANRPYSQKLKALRKVCVMVEMPALCVSDIEKRLSEVAAKEKVSIEKGALRAIAESASGDMRAALGDLESLGNRITEEDVRSLGAREREVGIQEALRKMFSADTIEDAKRAIDGVDLPLEEIFWWVESNVSKEYSTPEEIAFAFDSLSRADIFTRRIMKTGDWKLLSYFVDLMTAGVSSARAKKRFRQVSYNYPTMIAMLGRTKFTRMQQDKMLEEFSKELHCSKRKVRTEFLPYLKLFNNL